MKLSTANMFEWFTGQSDTVQKYQMLCDRSLNKIFDGRNVVNSTMGKLDTNIMF